MLDPDSTCASSLERDDARASIQEIPSILAQEFRLLRISEPGLGIDGAFTTSAHAWRGTVSEAFVQEHLTAPDPKTPTFEPRAASEQVRVHGG